MMSTNIDDLPDSEMLEETQEIQQPHYNIMQPEYTRSQDYTSQKHHNLKKKPEIIKIKKKEIKKSLFDYLKHEIVDNYQNFIMLILLVYVSKLRESNEYIKKILLLLPFNAISKNETIIMILTCLILTIAYLSIKYFVK